MSDEGEIKVLRVVPAQKKVTINSYQSYSVPNNKNVAFLAATARTFNYDKNSNCGTERYLYQQPQTDTDTTIRPSTSNQSATTCRNNSTSHNSGGSCSLDISTLHGNSLLA